MADIENEVVTVLSLKTGDSYTNINSLKEAVKLYREEVNAAAFGSDDYKESCDKLGAAQAALKSVTQASTAATAENWENTDIASKSYNQLTAQMAALKAQWRATTDEAERANIGNQILQINNRLKDLDASTGNFQRSVGDYATGVKKGLDAFKNGLGPLGKEIDVVNKAASGLAANPLMASMGILVQLFAQLSAQLQSSEEGQQSLAKASALLAQVMKPIQKLVAWLAEKLAALIDYIAPYMPIVLQWLGNAASMLAGVGNAILQYLLTPVRAVISAVKGVGKIIGDIVRGDFKAIGKDAKAAGEDIGGAFKKGLSFKANYNTGREMAANFAAGLKDKAEKKKAEEAGAELGEAAGYNVAEAFSKALAAGMKKNEALRKAMDEALKEEAQIIEDFAEEVDAEVSATFEETNGAFTDAVQQQMAAIEAEKAAQLSMVGYASGLLGTIADAYGATEASAQKHAGTIKALQAAEATINTISGAVGAFMGITSSTGGWGIAAAAAQAATILTAGYAQVRKILATDTSGRSTAAPATGATISATAVDAPQIDYAPQTVQTATGAAEFERLNAAKGDQRVVLVYSDVQAAGRQVAVQQSESSFY